MNIVNSVQGLVPLAKSSKSAPAWLFLNQLPNPEHVRRLLNGYKQVSVVVSLGREEINANLHSP